MSLLDAADDEVARARERLETAKGELRAAVRDAGGGPARDAAHAEEQARALRAAIGRDAAELRDRALDAAAHVDRARTTLAGAAAGAVALGIVAAALRRGAGRRRAQRSLEDQARSLARELVRIESLPARAHGRGRGASGALGAVGAAAAIAGLVAVAARRRAASTDEDLWLPER